MILQITLKRFTDILSLCLKSSTFLLSTTWTLLLSISKISCRLSRQSRNVLFSAKYRCPVLGEHLSPSQNLWESGQGSSVHFPTGFFVLINLRLV
jgi:hypothetical protein